MTQVIFYFLYFSKLLWLQVFTLACKSAVVFPVDGVPVVFPLSLKRVDFARCGFFHFATLGAVFFSALLACVSMPKVGHTHKACALNRSMAFLWLVVTCFCLFPSKPRWFSRVQQTSLAQAFLVRLCCSSSVATCQGLQARIMARVLPSLVVVLSILSAAFPSCLVCIAYTSPEQGANTCRKTGEKRAFYGLPVCPSCRTHR